MVNNSFIRTNWLGILVALLFLWLMFKPSGCGPNISKGKIDTVRVETKTEYVPQPPVYVPTYVPVQSGSTSYPVYIPADKQASTNLEALTKQYNELVKEYLATRKYKDSVVLKDSLGTRVGVVNLNDEVSENKITSRSPDYKLNFPHTTTTITLKEPYVPNNQVYIGGGITGNTTTPATGIYAGLMFKNKKDRVFGGTVGFQNYNGVFREQFSINTYWKIRLKK